jgi:hypothetical protein
MQTIKIRVQRKPSGLRLVVTALALCVVASTLVSAFGVAGALAMAGGVLGAGALAAVAVDRLISRLAVSPTVLWLGLASVSLLVAAAVVWGGALR